MACKGSTPAQVGTFKLPSHVPLFEGSRAVVNLIYFTMMSVHIKHQYAKNLGISKNLLLAVMVAGDFNGAAQRRRSGDDQLRDSTIEGSFANTTLPTIE